LRESGELEIGWRGESRNEKKGEGKEYQERKEGEKRGQYHWFCRLFRNLGDRCCFHNFSEITWK
jgi:hypothetical protein